MGPQEHWTRGVVKVGDGRGFLVETKQGRLIITAGHCLPQPLPPCTAFSFTEERTYKELIGELGKQAQPIWAECLMVDPVADLAVLGPPDCQERSKENDAYEVFAASAEPIPVGTVKQRIKLGLPSGKCEAWLLSLAGEWFRCRVVVNDRWMVIESASGPIEGGMSGSPIVDETGKAIGILTTGIETVTPVTTGIQTPATFLSKQLPRWLLDALRSF